MKKIIIPTILTLIVIVAIFHVFVFRYDIKSNQIVVGTPEEVEAKGFDPVAFGLPETAKEIVSQRTEKTATFLVGKQYAQVSTGADEKVTRDRFGNIVPVSEKGEILGREFVFDKLPGHSKIIFNLDKPEYTLFQDNYWFKVAFNSQSKGYVVDDNVVQYTLGNNAYLRWKVVGANVLKEITIEREGELPDLSFSFDHSTNLSLVNQKGIFELYNPRKELIFHTQRPFLMDTEGKELPVPVKVVEKNNRFSYEYKKEGLKFPYIIDPSAGPKSPATIVDDASIGTRTWSNPGNASSSNDVRATVTSSSGVQLSHYLMATNFGFSIPGSATIDGVVLEIERIHQSTGSDKDVVVRLVKGGTLQGNNYASSTLTWTTSDTYITYGTSTTDLWGLTLTPSDINASNFGAALHISVGTGA